MEVLRRSSVFAAEVLDVFDRSLTEKELVSQSKALCRDYILSRLNQNGLGWSKSELNLSPSNAALTEVSLVLLCLGERTLRAEYVHLPGHGQYLVYFGPHICRRGLLESEEVASLPFVGGFVCYSKFTGLLSSQGFMIISKNQEKA